MVDTNHISGTAEARVIEFCTPVGYNKSRYMEDESPLKGVWSVSRDPFSNFDTRKHIPGTTEARVAKFYDASYLKGDSI